MSGEVVNLRLARKAKARVEAARLAETNRVRFGRTKGQRVADAQEAARAERAIDGAKLEG